jgi:hypothetical protein
MPRTSISFPLIGRIRIGRSWSDAELRPRLASWRRFELRRGLQDAAKAEGEPMTREEGDYLIDKALAGGAIDAAGNPTPDADEATIAETRKWPAWLWFLAGALLLAVIRYLLAP